MHGKGPAHAVAALLLAAGLACGRTSIEARPASDAGGPEPRRDARGGLSPDADAAAEVGGWAASCRKNLASAGLGVNGTVWSLAIDDDDTVYLGGDFNWAGPLTGGGVPFLLPGGQPAPTFARVSGTVFAVAPDGAGGWFIGGWFDHVDNLPRKDLAHIGADGDVDPAFRADADDKVSAIAVVGDRVYVGGQFSNLGGAPRARLGRVDFKGAVAAWSPAVCSGDSCPSPSGTIQALLAVNGRLYVGGDFTQIAGAARANLAVFEADGTLGAWSPTVSRSVNLSGQAPVRAIASDGNTLWVGGEFDAVSGIPHQAIAAFDASGNLRSWDPGFEDFDVVAALAPGPNVLYVGGRISGSGPTSNRQTHSGLAAFDGSGAALAWNPVLATSYSDHETVRALALVGDTLFVGGSFTAAAGVPRAGLAALDRSGKVLDWDPSADGPIHAMAAQQNTLYAGGQVTTMCGQERNGLAAFAADGRLLDWNPNASGYVQAVVLRGETLLVGGGFSSVGGQDRGLMAEVSLSDGRPTALAPSFQNGGWITSIQPFGDAVYIGGGFTVVNGKPVSNIAALAFDGSLLPWSSAPGWGNSGPFAVLDDVLWVAGETDSGGAGQGKLAAFAMDGSPKGKVVDADQGIWALLADQVNGRVYAGGSFSQIAGASRPALAALDPSGNLLPWSPSFDSPFLWIDAIATFGDALLVAGVVKTPDSDLRAVLLALDDKGQPKPWNPDPNSDVRCLRVHKGTVYAGGSFTFIDGSYAAGFAKLTP